VLMGQLVYYCRNRTRQDKTRQDKKLQ
jgi:hypothetical protein